MTIPKSLVAVLLALGLVAGVSTAMTGCDGLDDDIDSIDDLDDLDEVDDFDDIGTAPAGETAMPQAEIHMS
jgi:hypothetical protein